MDFHKHVTYHKGISAFVGIGILLVAVICASIALGARSLDPTAVLYALQGNRSYTEASIIVWEQRIPRTLLGVLGGMALAIGGVLAQGHTKNPLADPGLLGVTAGASLAVIFSISVLGVTTPAGFLWFAYGGAAVGTLAVLAVGMATGRRRGASPTSLVLAGAAISALFGAINSVILLLNSATLDVYRFWTVGSLAGGRGVESLVIVGPLLAVGAGLAVSQSGALNVLSLGEDMAQSLGWRIGLTRLIGLISLTLLVGGATALVGSLGFIGLIAPHIARGIIGTAHGKVIPLSALLGAVLVLSADVIGRLIVAPAELPVGVILGVIGGPVFLFLVIRLFRRTR